MDKFSLTEKRSRTFANGKVYMLHTADNYPIETTDTFLPEYTKYCINEHTNELKHNDVGNRNGRWMIGVSCMSGCPVHCSFCLVPGTKILMADGEYKNIEDIEVGDKVVSAKHVKKATENSQEYASTMATVNKVLNTFKHEIDEDIYKITLKNGTVIEVTGNHRISASSGTARYSYIRADELKVGDRVKIFDIGNKSVYKNGRSDVWQIGYAVGFIAGDGNVHKVSNRKCIRCVVSQSDREIIQYVQDILNKHDINTTEIAVNKTKYNTEKTNYIFGICQGSLFKIDDTLVKPYKDSEDYKLGFIAGFYDSEGYSLKNNATMRFCNTDYDLLCSVKEMIDSIIPNANTRICLYESRAAMAARSEKNLKECYTLETNINKSKVKPIFGVLNPKADYRSSEKYSDERILDNRTMVKNIDIVRYSGSVYNIETENHNYIANNIVVHNCNTGKLKRWRNLTAEEIYEQVCFILDKNPDIDPKDSKEFKINYTRMGEPFLNIDAVRKAMEMIDNHPRLQGVRVHHYISTVGLRGSDFSWIKDNITLQVSLHSLSEERRHNLIPISNLMSIEELGQIRTDSDLKTTVNMTLVDTLDFDINKLTKYFDPKYFFIKLSPINENEISKEHNMGPGIIQQKNLI